ALHMVVDKLKNDIALAKEQEEILAKAGYDVNRLNDGKNLFLSLVIVVRTLVMVSFVWLQQ
ncbi:hypothetical protein LEA_13798, partial [human gut metagenome]